MIAAAVLMTGLAAVLALLPAQLAYGKGHSFGAFWLFALFLFVPALVVALAVGRRPLALVRPHLATGEWVLAIVLALVAVPVVSLAAVTLAVT